MTGNLRYLFLLILSSALLFANAKGQSEYKQLQKQLATGWNTWNTRSVLSHVKLPEGLAINIGFKSNSITSNRYLQESYLSEKDPRPENIIPGYHSYDGSYTECTVQWEGATVKVETAHDGDDLVVLITPIEIPIIKQHLVVEAGMLWNRKGLVQLTGKSIKATIANKIWQVQVSDNAKAIIDPLPIGIPYLTFAVDKIMGVSVGKKRTLLQIQSIVLAKRNAFENTVNRYGDLKETYLAQQSVLAWNMIYDAQRDAVIAPVSRVWNTFFGGHYVLFDWDTYLSGMMAGFDNKALAYANVIEVTKTVDDWGMVPNYVSAFGLGSPDRSQPPVGSMAISSLYKKYKDKWLLDMTYDRLLKWNRWWPKHRDTNGLLCWGTDDIPPDGAANTWQGAAYESGLDNAPMYDAVPFNKQSHQMALADVGLMSLYIADCKYLAELSEVMQRPMDAKEIRERAAYYTTSLNKLWNNDFGMFLNKRTDNNEWNFRLSPTLFYPLIAGVATPAQASRMINEHMLNTNEFWGEWVLPSVARNDTAFKQQDYWRGRIWAPLNFLVYQGLKNYNFPEVTKALVEKSNTLLIKNWRDSKGVFENYHASGIGRLPKEPQNTSDNFYHWGALLGYMYLLENQKTK